MINPSPPDISLVDTHCHIHFDDYGLDPDEVLAAARAVGVRQVICVGTTLANSQKAVEFAASRPGVWSAVGIHPHEASGFLATANAKIGLEALATSRANGLVAIGEVGLDYYYEHSPRALQQELLVFQLSLAEKYELPVIFHVRDAFADFWPIVDQFPSITGVVHSFSAGTDEMKRILTRGLFVGFNGIMTFSKDPQQLEAAKSIPLDRLILETDAPYLTPAPHRGKICTPAHLLDTATFLAELRGEPLEQLAQATTHNASQLFQFDS